MSQIGTGHSSSQSTSKPTPMNAMLLVVCAGSAAQVWLIADSLFGHSIVNAVLSVLVAVSALVFGFQRSRLGDSPFDVELARRFRTASPDHQTSVKRHSKTALDKRQRLTAGLAVVGRVGWFIFALNGLVRLISERGWLSQTFPISFTLACIGVYAWQTTKKLRPLFDE